MTKPFIKVHNRFRRSYRPSPPAGAGVGSPAMAALVLDAGGRRRGRRERRIKEASWLKITGDG